MNITQALSQHFSFSVLFIRSCSEVDWNSENLLFCEQREKAVEYACWLCSDVCFIGKRIQKLQNGDDILKAKGMELKRKTGEMNNIKASKCLPTSVHNIKDSFKILKTKQK